MKPGRVVALVIALVLFALPAVGMLVGGAVLTGAYLVERDDDGFFDETLERLATNTAAITTGDLDLEADPGPPEWLLDWFDATVRIKASPAERQQALFVGIGPVTAVDDYLRDVAHDEIIDVEPNGRVDFKPTAGTALASSPTDETFWVASASAVGPVEIEWDVESGEWAAVLMNADGSAGVVADVTVGIWSDVILGAGIAAIAVGAFLAALAVAIILVAVRGQVAPAPEAAVPVAPRPEGVPAAEPVSLTARLDEPLSPWLWLVKWFLAIPHLVVLAFLSIGAVLMTIAAGFVILFTGVYPRAIFDFNLGVLRWWWRVSFYAFGGGLGTDRYPPFSLQREDDYPATLDIDYPARLSRGLVLVKWWLLALPHYLVLAFLLGPGFGPLDDDWDTTGTILDLGLIALLVLIAAVVLLFTGRYPQPLFRLVVGLNRWAYRVVAYAALMTDRYPPFRLDQGGDEPDRIAPVAPPPEVAPVAPAE